MFWVGMGGGTAGFYEPGYDWYDLCPAVEAETGMVPYNRGKKAQRILQPQ